ncbi:MAG: hypothetical protein RRC34_01790 [Lentisphaeria bacterium]|nr:hypothetical protein [Lentisphaeria bacterium]
MTEHESLKSLPAGRCEILKRVIVSALLLLSVIPVAGEIVDKQMTVKPGGNTVEIGLPDPEKVCQINLTLIPAAGWRIVSSKLDSGQGWVPTAGNSYRLTYDPQHDVAYYTGHFSGTLAPTGGSGNGGGGGGVNLKDFSATAELKAELKVTIGDSDSGSQTFKDQLTFRVGTDLSRVKAYFVGIMNQKGDLVTDASACSWSINGQPAGNGASLSNTNFPSAYKDTNGNIKAGAYNVQLDYKDANTNVTSIATKKLNLVGVKSLAVARGDAPDNTVTTSIDEEITVATMQSEEAIPTLYIPYTEDEAGDSTTTINLSAISYPLGVWPDDKPDWTLLDAEGNTVDELAGLDGQQAPTDTCTLPAPGTYTIKAECGNELAVKIIASSVKILQVPEFLFASANYATTIKWQITGLSGPVTIDSLDAIKITFSPDAYHSISLGSSYGETGFLEYTVAIEGEPGVFETYVKQEHIRQAVLSEPHVSNSASFAIEVELECNDQQLALYGDSEEKIKAYADNTVFARDIDSNSEYADVTDTRAVVTTVPETRWECQVKQNMPTDWYFGTTQTIDFDEVFQENGYWPSGKPRFMVYHNFTPDQPLFHGFLLGNEDTYLGYRESEPNTYLQGVYAMEPYTEYYGWDPRMLGRGHYKGYVVANRIGVMVFISYGGKQVSVPAGDFTAMDLSIDQPAHAKVHGGTIIKMSATVSQEEAPDPEEAGSMNHDTWIGPTIAAASILSCWLPGGATTGKVVSTILGTGSALYEASKDDISSDVKFSGHGYAQVKIWHFGRKSTDCDITKIINQQSTNLMFSLAGNQVTTTDGNQEQDGVDPVVDFDGRGLVVGDMFGYFIETNTTAQMEARRTGEDIKRLVANTIVKIENPENFKVWLSQ